MKKKIETKKDYGEVVFEKQELANILFINAVQTGKLKIPRKEQEYLFDIEISKDNVKIKNIRIDEKEFIKERMKYHKKLEKKVKKKK